MEKRTTVALVLSFLVLFVWTWLFPSPKPNNLKTTQILENKELTSESNKLESSVSSEPAPPSLVLENLDETIDRIENDNIAINISNLGATIDSAEIKQYKNILPISGLSTLSSYDRAPFQLIQKSNDYIEYIFKDAEYSIIKSYKLLDDGYTVLSNLKITNISEMSKEKSFKWKAFYIDGIRMDNNSKLAATLWEHSYFSNNYVHRKKSHPKFNIKNHIDQVADIDWVGFRDQYYCAIMKPLYKATHFVVNPANEQVLDVFLVADNVVLAPGQSINMDATIYIGPQDVKALKNYNSKFEDIVDFRIGNFFDVMAFGLTDVIAKIMSAFLHLVHNILPNWGLCIVVFAFAIFAATYPLTKASMTAMKKMQDLQPKIAKLREQYKSNPQKMNEELMLLYKKNKANPFGGCLPVLLQMPIFVSLYQLLWRSYVFKGADFLWIKDLSEPDRLFILPFSIPFVGNEFNILPLLYAGLMFVQQKIMAKNAVYMDPQQAEMQKMMAIIMPIMLGFLFYKFASGLCLYFTVYFLLSTAAQWKMKSAGKEAVDEQK